MKFVLNGQTVNHMQYFQQTFCLYGAISQNLIAEWNTHGSIPLIFF